MIEFVIGLFIGELVGVFTMSLCIIARDADERGKHE